MGNETKLINFYKKDYWKIETLSDIVSIVKSYTDKKKLKDVELVEIEDSSLQDVFDVIIQYPSPKAGFTTIQQKLLILKGEVIDGEGFHMRAKEFYD